MYFTLYPHNIPVAGSKGAAIYDLQNESLTIISQPTFKLIKFFERYSIEEITQDNVENTRLILASVDLLCKNDYGLTSRLRPGFRKLGLEWHCPGVIAIAVVEIDLDNLFDIFMVVRQISALHCKCIELRICNTIADISRLVDILEAVGASISIKEMCLFLTYNEHADYALIYKAIHAAPVLITVFILNYPEGTVSEYANIHYLPVHESPDINVEPDHMSHIVNLRFFTESQQYNPYFNRRVCISKSGAIKNCLTHQQDFGNVSNNMLADVVKCENFQLLWHAHADVIEEIRELETRYAVYSNKNVMKDGSTYRYCIN